MRLKCVTCDEMSYILRSCDPEAQAAAHKSVFQIARLYYCDCETEFDLELDADRRQYR